MKNFQKPPLEKIRETPTQKQIRKIPSGVTSAREMQEAPS